MDDNFYTALIVSFSQRLFQRIFFCSPVTARHHWLVTPTITHYYLKNLTSHSHMLSNMLVARKQQKADRKGLLLNEAQPTYNGYLDIKPFFGCSMHNGELNIKPFCGCSIIFFQPT